MSKPTCFPPTPRQSAREAQVRLINLSHALADAEDDVATAGTNEELGAAMMHRAIVHGAWVCARRDYKALKAGAP